MTDQPVLSSTREKNGMTDTLALPEKLRFFADARYNNRPEKFRESMPQGESGALHLVGVLFEAADEIERLRRSIPSPDVAVLREALEGIEDYLANEVRNYENLFEAGKGEHGKPGYVTDATWNSWSGSLSAARGALEYVRRARQTLAWAGEVVDRNAVVETDELVEKVASWKAKLEKAHKMVSALCNGEQRWILPVPANHDTDPDLVIGAGLMAGDEAVAAIRALSSAPSAVENMALGKARSMNENWRRCPSTHCERRGECTSPSDCIIKSSAADRCGDALQWAVSRWKAEVENRPLQNIHRRSLDDTWRQVIRYFGGDPVALCGPSHDELRALATAPTAERKK